MLRYLRVIGICLAASLAGCETGMPPGPELLDPSTSAELEFVKGYANGLLQTSVERFDFCRSPACKESGRSVLLSWMTPNTVTRRVLAGEISVYGLAMTAAGRMQMKCEGTERFTTEAGHSYTVKLAISGGLCAFTVVDKATGLPVQLTRVS